MRDTSLYSINDIRKYVDVENFGLILDAANAKYNAAIWRRYADWGTPTNDREWLQGEKETPILVRASVLGLHSNKPQRNTEGWKVYGGTLPKIGHGFSIDESDLIELRKRSKLNDIPYANLITDSLIQNSGNMLGGIHAELNYMLLQALSTGQINDVAVDGASYDFKFPIKDNRFTKFDTGKAWFGTNGTANADADPIQDLLDAQDYYTDDLNLAVDHWKVSKKLLKKFCQHPAVKAAILATMDYHSENIPNVILTEDKILTAVHDLGVWMFDVIDHKSRHEEDGVPVNDAPAFDEHNFVAAPSTFKPFEMKCMNSIYKDRVNMGGMTAANLYSFVEDRIAVLSTWQERPIENIIDCELYAGPVFKNLSEIGIFTVYTETPETPEGDGDNEGGNQNRQFTITVLSADTEMGTVTGGGTFSEGSVIQISAVAVIGNQFEKWSDGVTTPNRNITVTQDLTLTASFVADEDHGGGDGGAS